MYFDYYCEDTHVSKSIIDLKRFSTLPCFESVAHPYILIFRYNPGSDHVHSFVKPEALYLFLLLFFFPRTFRFGKGIRDFVKSSYIYLFVTTSRK